MNLRKNSKLSWHSHSLLLPCLLHLRNVESYSFISSKLIYISLKNIYSSPEANAFVATQPIRFLKKKCVHLLSAAENVMFGDIK